MEDNKYYGIYRGVVVDNNDPLDRGRLKVLVPQVSGESVTEWAWPVLGGIGQHDYPHGTFTRVSDQSAEGTNTETRVVYEYSEDEDGVYFEGSRIYVRKTGHYYIAFSNTFASTSSSSQTVNVWFKLNGASIPRSNTQFIMSGNPNEMSVSKGGTIPLRAGDYLELAFSVSSSTITLSGSPATAVHPEAASSVFTLYMVGDFMPEPNVGVWVTYEGGDPNFPLWIGVF